MMTLLFSGRRMVTTGQAWATFKTGTLWQRYEKYNPVESARVDNYWTNGGQFPATATPTGLSLSQMIAAQRGDING